jgi:hypothetical protein
MDDEKVSVREFEAVVKAQDERWKLIADHMVAQTDFQTETRVALTELKVAQAGARRVSNARRDFLVAIIAAVVGGVTGVSLDVWRSFVGGK